VFGRIPRVRSELDAMLLVEGTIEHHGLVVENDASGPTNWGAMLTG